MSRRISTRDLDRKADGRFTVTDPTLEALGREIGQVYCRLLFDRFGIRQTVGARKAWVLYRAAELARTHGLAADEFVTRQLAQMAVQGTFWPEALASWATAERAEKLSRDDDPIQCARYAAQLGLAARLQALYGPTIYRDPMWPFSPIIRHVMAVRAGDHAFVESVKGAVRLEAAQHHAARTLLGLL